MTKEASKSMTRRASIDAFQHIFAGNGIDIGAGDDCVSQHSDKFSRMLDVRDWDLKDGDAQYMEGVPDNSFDFVHSSHCLEHMRDPHVALGNWLRIVKVGGHVVVTIPDWEMYEKYMWPSRYNRDHKTAWTMDEARLADGAHVVFVPDFLDDICRLHNAAIFKLERIEEGWDPNNKGDQTLPPSGPECAIEFVLRKK